MREQAEEWRYYEGLKWSCLYRWYWELDYWGVRCSFGYISSILWLRLPVKLKVHSRMQLAELGQSLQNKFVFQYISMRRSQLNITLTLIFVSVFNLFSKLTRW